MQETRWGRRGPGNADGGCMALWEGLADRPREAHSLNRDNRHNELRPSMILLTAVRTWMRQRLESDDDLPVEA